MVRARRVESTCICGRRFWLVTTDTRGTSTFYLRLVPRRSRRSSVRPRTLWHLWNGTLIFEQKGIPTSAITSQPNRKQGSVSLRITPPKLRLPLATALTTNGIFLSKLIGNEGVTQRPLD